MKAIKYPDHLRDLSKYLIKRRDLARLGGYRDGGYVVIYHDILSSNKLISGGVGSNARFESDCIDVNPKLKPILIDKSFNRVRILIRVLYHFLQKKEKGYNSLVEAICTFRVLSKSSLIKEFLTEKYTLEEITPPNISDRLLIKLDIEGWEYSQLEAILKLQANIQALCIEFHDLQIEENYTKLIDFVKNINLDLVYISINETSIVDATPQILELSFSRRDNTEDSNSYLQASSFPGDIDCRFFV